MNRRDALRVIIGGAASFLGGAGAQTYRPGFYQIATNWDGRYGIPGPREVVDLTGIAAGFRVYQMLKHADTNVAITSDGTDTKVYRLETTWVEKATITARVPTGDGCAVSFKAVLAIAFGSANAYQFTTGTGAGAWTFTASTKTSGTSARANYFLAQTNGLLVPRVVYVRNPNEVYYTEDLSNGDATGVNPTYIGDNSADQQAFRSIAEEPRTGRVLYGMRHALFTLDADGVAEKLTEDFADPILDAGGQSDRLNFEGPVLVAGRLYYPVEGYDILEWDGSGTYNRYMAPRWLNRNLPRLSLPINALASAGGYLIAFLGSKNTGTLKAVTYAPGGSAHLANSFTTASEMWVGAYVEGRFVWHGILLLCTDPLRYAWFDEDTAYLYLASGDSEAADAQMRRCLFYTDNPDTRPTSGTITLATGTWQLEVGAIDFGDEWALKRAEHIRLNTLGLASATPSLEPEYKISDDNITTAFESGFAPFTSNEIARLGERFPDGSVFHKLHLRFVGVGNAASNLYAKLLGAEVRATSAVEQEQEALRR